MSIYLCERLSKILPRSSLSPWSKPADSSSPIFAFLFVFGAMMFSCLSGEKKLKQSYYITKWYRNLNSWCTSAYCDGSKQDPGLIMSFLLGLQILKLVKSSTVVIPYTSLNTKFFKQINNFNIYIVNIDFQPYQNDPRNTPGQCKTKSDIR